MLLCIGLFVYFGLGYCTWLVDWVGWIELSESFFITSHRGLFGGD